MKVAPPARIPANKVASCLREAVTPMRCRGRWRGYFLLILNLMKTGFSMARFDVPARMKLSVLALSCAAIFPVAAQTVAQLPTTTVTANRFEQDIQSAPVAVSVLTGAQILASGATDGRYRHSNGNSWPP